MDKVVYEVSPRFSRITATKLERKRKGLVAAVKRTKRVSCAESRGFSGLTAVRSGGQRLSTRKSDMLLALKHWGVTIRFSTSYNHDSNEEVERFNRVINEVIAVYKAENIWDIIIVAEQGVSAEPKQVAIS
ncbi:Ribonuclease H-like domain-containing protein [Strongyloides ratti]|uniref:Ribonuclease H-like domain-containing protein n=1 Tax=Strongyloides ratti TaxID=34506 RepID=A0A090MT58_STRRB|nr:Ribonuclease H-like domain-containing protein [Strongyloides ratti]CEF61508.1 Ribonuclease H-like domain-containing protein [Strongyloides ratti]